ENVGPLMAELHRQYPDDRERSLFASVELSLRRFSPETREKIRVLAVFHGGAHAAVFGIMHQLDAQATRRVFAELIHVGLGEDMGYGHLRLDPALPAYLLGRMDAAEEEQTRARWADAMQGLLGVLYEQAFKDAGLAARLTLLELPNLLALLDALAQKAAAEEVVDVADSVETLVAPLGRPRALAQVVAVREAAAKGLSEWSHARFQAASKTIDRLLDAGDLPSAHTAARKLLNDSLAAARKPFPEAAYDTAAAHWRLGRVLRMGGAAGAALKPLTEARRRFETLAASGIAEAERMASAAITEQGDCLRALGRLDEAAAAYEEAGERFGKIGDERSAAVAKGQLGTVRMNQGRHADALAAYDEAKKTFEALGEPGTVAVIWHQIGIVHREAGQFDQAERAYRQSLAIKVQRQDTAGEASSLLELGNLYDAMGRLEEAVAFYRQAADKYVELGDMADEGRTRNNAADTLIKLGRHDEARREIERAIECKEPYGHAAEPWKTWGILYDLEQATGHPQAAAEARAKAVRAFLDYRRAGGENHSGLGPQLCRMVTDAIAQNQTQEGEAALTQLATRPDLPRYAKALIPALQAVLAGNRDPALADDPNLDYDDAAELLLLLERAG
ncbi:MAG TPA: tetratricopeptide repeat protein, partial [Thermoguttaceae bacterium]|nr:tetratricopeptide repeat protein [Thermoguttaceae bacterium]